MSNETLIGFGDSEEVTARNLIHRMRHCELKTSVFDIGNWFTYDEVQTAFKTDWPIRGLPYTFAGASFFTLAEAKESRPYPTYRRGKYSPNALLGGQHLPHYNYLPFLLTKALTITDGKNNKFVQNRFEKLKKFDDPRDATRSILDELDSLMKEVVDERFSKVDRLLADDPVYEHVVVMPWFLMCNKERYPAWFQKLDPRQMT